MDLDALRTTTLGFVEAHKDWAPLIAGVLAFCESIAFLSLLVPATVILIGIGAMIGATGIPFWPVVAAAALGAALGDWLSYEFGRHYGDGAKGMWPMRRYPEMVEKGEVFLKRWGAAAVAVGRFFGPARAVVPLIAGMFGVARLPFQVANVLSAVVWAFILLAPGAGLLTWFQD
ncbi:DedA family protein [Methylobacterium trifolii]|uniref:Inner membrane protein YabI n=1 Tax=Methylobacterium trifolii TaxID=1003092 RepID=A0ABQ4TTX8_9HYPH|nr:DedA family protein [Methylobacterium trifolii]GJE58771.1 Inner membrane protein YabI [Methylobacterium trifolii]